MLATVGPYTNTIPLGPGEGGGAGQHCTIYWVPVPGSPYKLMLSITQEPTIWVPGLLGKARKCMATGGSWVRLPTGARRPEYLYRGY